MKKYISLIIAFVMLLSTATISANAKELPYKDVKERAWYFGDVKYVTDNGIMNGTSDTRFEPSATLSRAMAVTILYRMAHGSVAEGTENPFTDVKNGKWYTDAVLWAYGCGIVTGKTEKTFDPNSFITRADFATMLSRYAYAENLELPEVREYANFSDAVITPKYAQLAEKILYTAGVINGFPNNRFMHYETITRAQAAAMIHRFNETAEPHDKDAYTDVVFIGNSITATGKTPAHFEALAGGKNVKVYNHSVDGNRLNQHYEWFLSENMSIYTGRVQNAEVVILQEYAGGLPEVGYDEELNNLCDEIKLPFYIETGDNTVQKLMDFLGADKDYYSYSANILCGPMKDGKYLDSDNNETEYDNDILLEIRDILAKKYSISHMCVANIAASDPTLGLHVQNDMYPDLVHPTELMGYVIALVMYCEIFDVPATEQNNGVLSDDAIPGKTPEEKAQFMEKLKINVQEMIDVQKLDK